jgi:DNA repair protein RadA/Sms
MGKNNSYLYECQSCGQKFTRWEGRCFQCNEWNTVAEIKDDAVKTKKGVKPSNVLKLCDIGLSATPRISTGSKELDRVLGGGIVKGASVLIGGEPGIGKSTLLLELADRVCSIKGQKVLYITGEESLEQVRLRAERLNINTENLLIASETSLYKVLSTIDDMAPTILIIDSIQAIYDEELKSPMGSFSQLRQTVGSLLELTKSRDISTFLIGHVTKEGMIAGPKLIEHMVDAVIYFEGDENMNYRVLRTMKNRFGPSNEIGIFEMKATGLEDVENPSSFFLSGRSIDQPGSVVGAIITGSRPILIEIQSLITPSYIPMPRRTVVGYEANRVAMLLAIMEKYFHYNFSNSDLFVNIVGGLKTQEPALDLAVMTAIASSYLAKKPNSDFFIIGEVGLTGEVRKIPRIVERINEAERIGFKSAIIPQQEYVHPKAQAKEIKTDLAVTMVKNISEVFDVVFN